MSVGNDLQEMEVSTKKSVTAVNSSAKPGESMPKATIPGEGLVGGVEDLGGPTPQNSKSTDDSNKYKTPTGKLKAVRDVQHKGASTPDPMQKANTSAMSYEETEADEEDVVSEYEEDQVGDEEEELDETSNPTLKDVIDMITNEDLDHTDDINALMEGENLSDSFIEKATTIFEAAVKSKIIAALELLQSQYQTELESEVDSIREDLTQRLDAYLEYVAEEWVEENALQVETGIRSELSESFMTGLKGLFEEHYVEIPEEKYNVLEGMVERLDEMESKLNEQITRNVQLNQRLSEAVSGSIFNDVSEGLALTQKEKLASLVESVGFESENTYRKKLETLRESYFPRALGSKSEEILIQENIEDYSPQMNSYLKAISKFK